MTKNVVLLCAAVTLFAGETGIRPRASASDYPARQTGPGVTLGAAIVPPDQVKKLFAVDLNKLGYTVVEMAVYPDRDVDIATRDFVLRLTSDGTTLRPVAPSTIAARLNKDKKPSQPPQLPGHVQVYGSQTVGYESGSYGGRRAGGVYTESTVGVGVGDPRVNTPPPPATSGKAKDSMSVQVELESVALQEGRFDQRIAGYLYYPSVPRKAAVEITWYGPDGQLHLTMPSTK